MKKFMITILAMMLVSTVVFADGYKRRVIFKKNHYKVITKKPYYKNHGPIYKAPVHRAPSYKVPVRHVPVINIFTLQFSGLNRAQQSRIISFFSNGSSWGTASVSRNYFTGTITVQVRSSWGRANLHRSILSSLSGRGVSLSVRSNIGYNAIFVATPVQQFCH